MKQILTLLLVLLSTFTFAQTPSYVPSNGLVSWWPFNGNANDESGNGNNGTVNGATLTADRNGVPNSAYYFSSSGCATRIDANVNTSSIQTGMSISIWVLRSGTGCLNPRIFEFYSGSGGPSDAFLHWFNNNTAFGSITSSGTFVSASFVPEPDNIWIHLVYTNDGVIGKFYKNGVLFQSTPSSGSVTLANNVSFGRMNHPAWDAFNGKIDDIGIWNRALTQSEITNLYNSVNTPAPTVSVSPASTTVCPGSSATLTATTSGSTACSSSGLPTSLQTGLVGYWPFCGNANDASGNGNNGTVNGATLTIDRFGNTGSAYSFDGIDDYISLVNSLPDCSVFTISTWLFHSKGLNYSGILSDATTFTGNDLYFNLNDNSLGLKADKSGATLFQCPLPEVGFSPLPLASGLNMGNQWKHVVIIVDPSQTKVYINSILVATLNIGGSNIGYHALNPVFGKITDGDYSIQFFGGKLDDIAIWNRALTATEIQQLYTTSNATYSWSPGGATTQSITVSPTTTTTYTVTATANGQSSTSTAVVTVTTPPTITASSSSICAGQSATLTAAAAGSSTTTPCSGLTGSLSSGLVGYWPFCGNANDFSGNGYNLNVTGDASLTTGHNNIANSAYQFTTVSNNSRLEFNTNNYNIIDNLVQGTVSFWVKINVQEASNHFFGFDNMFSVRQKHGVNTQLLIGLKSGTMKLRLHLDGALPSSGDLESNSVLNIGIWYHVTYAWDGQFEKVFINGVLDNQINSTNSITTMSNPNMFCFGSYTGMGSTSTHSNLDDIGIWNRALTTAEIQQLYTQGQTTYSWSPGGETTPSITVSPTSTTTYTCSVTTNGTTCSSSQTITVNALPVASITPAGPVSLCQGQSVTLCAPNTPGLTYLWCNASTTSCITTNFAGNYCLVITDANGCTSNSVSTIVDVLPLPTANAGLDFTKTCVTNPSGTLVGMTSVAGNTYAWTPATGLSSASSANPTANPTATTTYTLTATNTASGCTATDQVLVTVNTTLPTVNAGLDQTLCQGVSTVLNVSSNGATLSWNNGVQNNVSFVPSTVGSTTYTATAIGSNGCTANDNVVVTVNPLPSTAVTTNGTSSFCPGSSVQLCAPSGTGYSYLWSGNLGTTQCVTLSSSATTSVTVTNAFNCSATSAPQQVTVFNNPLASAGLDATITCLQNASGAQIGDVPNPTYTYNWTPSSGLSSATIGNPIANPSTTTTYTLTVVNADGCMGSDQVTVTVNNALPTANAGQGGIITCAQNVNGVQLGAGPINGNTYSWTPTSGLNNSNIANPTATPNTSTTYTLLMSDANGCSDTAQVVVTVNNNAPIVFAGNDVNVCYGDSLYLLANTTIGSTVLWNATIQNGSNILPTQSGYQVATATATNGCTSQDSLLVSILQPTTSTLNEVACDEFILNGNVYLQSGTYTQLLTNTAGCDSTITLNLTINLSPDTPVVYVQNEVNLSTDVILGQTYQWIYCSDLIPVPGATNPTFNPAANAIYAVVVTNNCGSDTSSCTTVSTIGLADSQQTEVEIYPNPNNGHFIILLPENNGSAKLEVLDLNGRIIFESILDQQANELHLETLSSGTYWLRINQQVPVPVTKY